MNWIKDIEGVDIYIIDQILKGRISPASRILDAGCGTGRNIRPFLENGFDFIAIDPDEEKIRTLKDVHRSYSDNFLTKNIEDFEDESGFDLIICSAVLHFAQNDEHFNTMFEKLVKLLQPEGILFIRMTSNMGMNSTKYNTTGNFELPDGTTRYLITRERIDDLQNENSLSLLDPVKSTLVEDLRSMTTIVFQKSTPEIM